MKQFSWKRSFLLQDLQWFLPTDPDPLLTANTYTVSKIFQLFQSSFCIRTPFVVLFIFVLFLEELVAFRLCRPDFHPLQTHPAEQEEAHGKGFLAESGTITGIFTSKARSLSECERDGGTGWPWLRGGTTSRGGRLSPWHVPSTRSSVKLRPRGSWTLLCFVPFYDRDHSLAWFLKLPSLPCFLV